MTWSLWTAAEGNLSVRPLRELTDAEAPAWNDRTLPAGLGATGARSPEDRLGWVDLPLAAAAELPEYRRLRGELLAEGLDHLAVLAMGGSALGARALVSGLGRTRGLEVWFLDSLAPEAVREAVRPDRLGSTAFLVASKSGATVETRTLEAVVFQRLQAAGTVPGGQFLAVSDPGSPLHRWADRAGYRRRFAAKPNVGGRFSALSVFGLLPAALAGCALDDELSEVRRVRETLDGDGGADPAFRLGALLARLWVEGRFRAHLTASPEHKGVLPWLEQLFAESTGKDGAGMLPVLGGAPPASNLGKSDLLIHLGPARGGDRERLEAAANAGVPVIHCAPGECGLLPLLFRWQIAVSVAAFRMGVDPYDQPDVEGTKAAARRLAADPGAAARPPALSDADLREFLEEARGGGVVINAFGHRSPSAEASLGALQRRLAARLGATPAIGFGSALLHSLGQIEKGGPRDLSVLMLTWDSEADVPIPPSPELPPALSGLGTGAFARLQAAADYAELKRRGRRVLWLDAALPGGTGLAGLAARLADTQSP